ncbi:uncharacterized protein B0H18DRAFT_1028883 [Fomitopsis serialis]|uniref:uncharacterized protein n=1 Tax=Fomitopsis serialis TaxID=139415 RepID=UPI002007B999|nr:uncharacterized protein B0H18DRAFT_1028883 [Neoantrodia serialis]KAH9919257.1 hypothetical protein B0H18DRAFT_1028883 [Neoantrodia serialis]
MPLSAQARHRAKRKAYIKQARLVLQQSFSRHSFHQLQLETTVTKLQAALTLSLEQVAALPAPANPARELVEENEVLHRQVDELRRQMEDRNSRLRPDLGRRHGTIATSPYVRGDYDTSRRRLPESQSQVYLHAQNGHTHSRPPPLSIPSSTSFQTQPSQLGVYPGLTSSALTSYGMYQIPGIPSSSGTSTASISPFSPSGDYTPPSTTIHTHHHPSLSANSPWLLASYRQVSGQYEYAEVEEDKCACD